MISEKYSISSSLLTCRPIEVAMNVYNIKYCLTFWIEGMYHCMEITTNHVKTTFCSDGENVDLSTTVLSDDML